MIVLTIRTDKPEAELGLYEDETQLAYETWQAHRQLAETIHRKIETLLSENGKKPADIQGIVCFQGPGSFTGLRIGLAVGNAYAMSLAAPIVGSQGDNWAAQGIRRLYNSETDYPVVPEYGAPVHITQQKK